MAFTFGSKRVYLNQPATLYLLWLAIPLIFLFYFPTPWNWVAAGISWLAGIVVTMRFEDASVGRMLESFTKDGTPMFRDLGGGKVLGFGQESLAFFNANSDALKAWEAGWEGWKDLEEKHGATFFQWNGLHEVQGGSPISPMVFRFENDKTLRWFPACPADRDLALNCAARISSLPMKKDEVRVNALFLKPFHLVLVPMILLSIMVFLIGIGLVQPMDVGALTEDNPSHGPIFLITWEMIHQVQNWVPQKYLSEASMLSLALTLWVGYLFSRRQHTEASLRLQEPQGENQDI